MSRSETLRLQDVRDAYRLIGECRDLGSDPARWHPHLCEGLARLFGVVQANGGEGQWVRPGGTIQPLSAYLVSAEPVAHERYLAYHRANGMAADPIFQALTHIPARVVTRTRRQLVPDTVWYRSVSFNEFRRNARIDHELTSVFQLSDDGAISVIALNRSVGERDFSPREQRLLYFFHTELGRLIRGPLVSVTEPGVDPLAPRLRQTLACLLEGDSEKQVAARLGLSHATVHQYVTALYRHFGVTSRAQLLVHVLKRRARARRPVSD